METLLVVVALSIPAGLVWLVVSHVLLRGSVRELRAEVGRLKAGGAVGTADDPASTPVPSPQAVPQAAPRPPPAPGPWSGTTASASAPAPPAPAGARADPAAYVFVKENAGRLKAWIQENWLIVVGALSLAMAGVFLVQYGIEQGVLSPPLRVACSLAFGAGLVAFGERVRRWGGDARGDATAFLPSAFAGAGIVTLFSGILAARGLYDLIGAEVAFAALAAIAVLAVVLGWVYGPFLTVIGLLGATAAPFLVGGGSESVTSLFYYFALVAAVGLGVDAMKRSAWISSMALAAPTLGAVLVWLGSGSEHALGYAVLVAGAATCIPTLSLRPAPGGAMVFRMLHRRGAPGWPEFPVRLIGAGILILTGFAVAVSLGSEAGFWLGLGALAACLGVLAFWLERGAVLDDLAVPVALAMLATIGMNGLFDAPAAATRSAGGDVLTPLVGFALAVTAATGWKSLRTTAFALPWAAGSAVFAPATILLLAQFWTPLAERTAPNWAIHVLAVAALMTLLAERTRRSEGAGGLRTALFALAGLNMVAFALSVVLTETALTLGLAGVVVSAAWLDRRFDLPPVGWFVQLGVVACGFRLVVDPGIPWALTTGFGELATGFLGVIVLLAGAWGLLRTRGRRMAMIVVESAIWGLGGIFLCFVLYRALDDGSRWTHWSWALFGMIWMINAAVQLYRMRIDGPMRWIRRDLGWIFGVAGLGMLAVAALHANPLFRDRVIGPPVFDSLMVAYLLPALLIGAVAWRFDHLDRAIRTGLGAAASASAVLYAGLEIRRLWQGPDLTGYGFEDGELYSYTIAMLLCGSGLLLAAYFRRSTLLRKAAVAVIGLTIAKVFLVDTAGLEGLIRALSFLALGLVLAGLALLNRWITQRLEGE